MLFIFTIAINCIKQSQKEHCVLSASYDILLFKQELIIYLHFIPGYSKIERKYKKKEKKCASLHHKENPLALTE